MTDQAGKFAWWLGAETVGSMSFYVFVGDEKSRTFIDSYEDEKDAIFKTKCINAAYEKAVAEAVRAAREEMRERLSKIRELMPEPCEHFAFHGAVLETIDDAIRSIEAKP